MEHFAQFFTLRYYKEQMTGWTKSSYILLTVGLISQLIIGFMGGISLLSLTSTLAGMIGFTCTLAITNKRSINGILGFVSAIMLIYVATQTHNFSDIVMQLAYILLLDIPIIFSKRWNGTFESRSHTWKTASYTVIFMVVSFAALYYLDTRILFSEQALLDALAAMIGLTGAFLCVLRFKSQYYFWSAQGLLSVALWAQTAMHGHPVYVLLFTYMLYLANDAIAFFDSNWFKKKHA